MTVHDARLRERRALQELGNPSVTDVVRRPLERQLVQAFHLRGWRIDLALPRPAAARES